MKLPDLPEKMDINSLLKKQGYSLAGTHSAVKTCLWLRHSLREEGQCYKSQFYGITSHRCMQMTPTLLCNQRCLHCWRPVEVDAPIPEKWDSPMEIVGSSIKSQQKLVSGFGGSAPRELWEEANEPAHVAISLSGEPTMYPYLPELVEEFRREGLSTFVVTNGTNPDMVEKISPSQLYMSLDAPDAETYEKVCNPMIPGLWERIKKSLYILREKECRTAIRITLVKGLNMFNPEGYASLIKEAEPDFVEVKAYMHLGFSRRRLERDAMPTHDEVEKFASEVSGFLGYPVVDSSPISRVVLLSKEAGYTKSLPL